MAAHWIGKKKLSKFSRKTGTRFISGENVSGTALYVMMSEDGVLHQYNSKDDVLIELSKSDFYYDSNKRDLKLRADYLKATTFTK